MPLSDIVNVVISATTNTPTLPGFGEPLIMAYTSVFSAKTMEFSSLSSMVSAGFAVTDPAYLCALKVFSQNPTVPFLKVGRRTLAYTQVLHMQCNSTSTADTYSFKLSSPGGAVQTVTVASTGVPNTDVATINTAVTALGISHLTATHTTSPAVLVLTMAAGFLLDVQPDLAHTTFSDVTADPGIATDIAAVYAVDSNWYGLLLDCNSPAEISATAAWAEANGPHLFITNCSDTEIGDPASTTDVAYTLKQSAYARTALLFSASQLLSYSGAAWMGNRFPFQPGSDTWAFKTLAGVLADPLNVNQVHAIEAKNANVYTTLAGLNITQFGTSASGEFLDITRFIDWLQAQLQVQIFGTLANNAKIPYTDGGIDTIRSIIAGVLEQGIQVGGIASTPNYVINVPKAASVDAINKGKRNLPNVNFTATLAGAIHTLTITGVLQ